MPIPVSRLSPIRPALLIAVLPSALLAACGGGDSSGPSGETAAGTSLTGITWQWQGSTYSNDASATPDDTGTYTITFADDGTYLGQADCNSIRGTYTFEDSSITVSPAASTLIGCPPGSLATGFTHDLEGAAIATFPDGDLLIDLFADAGTMRFSPAP